jgi:hypothetical protein
VLLSGRTVARDHGPHAVFETGETNHADVDEKKQNKKISGKEVNGPRGLLAA